MNFNEAMENLDGLMLGDGGLQRYKGGACYQMSQSKILALRNHDPIKHECLRQESLKDHLKWERWIADNVFKALGIPVCEGHPKLGESTRCSGLHIGEKYRRALLITRYSPLLKELYREWYSGGGWTRPPGNEYIHGATKVLPVRIMDTRELPTQTLTQWFLGDGTSSWGHPHRSNPYVCVNFSTCCFTEEEVYHLMWMLNNMGLVTRKPERYEVRNGSGLQILLSATAVNTNRFMDLVEPHILEIFGDSSSPSYKDMIKYRRD